MRTTRIRHWAAGPAAALLILGGLAGCSVAGGPSTGDATSPATGAPAPSTAPPPSGSDGAPTTGAPVSPSPRSGGAFGLLEAMKAAQKSVDGVVTDAELARYGEASAWQVDLRQSRTVTVEVIVTGDGKVQNQRRDVTDDEARTVPDYPAGKAVEAAQQRVQGQPTSIELDQESGRRVWQVKISRPGDQPVEVSYDAASGQFVKQQLDN